jgi:YVTN family beta-propeller protein
MAGGRVTDFNLSAQGDVNVAGDVVGRDKIVNNIQNIIQRALTAAEEAKTDRELELQELAKGVEAIARRLQGRVAERTVTRGNPYKGLLTYRLNDSELFFGREEAIRDVLNRLSKSNLTVIHSESGTGKSSLLQAGVMPQLLGRGHLPVYVRPYTAEPNLAIKRAFLPDLGSTPLLATAPLREFLHQVTNVLGPDCRLYLFIDQAEELFTVLGEPARNEFVNELADCLDDESLNVRWALSMRTDFFGNLASFRPRVRDPFANDYRLVRLTPDEAKAAITEPARRRAVLYEDGLVDEILQDLHTKEVAPPDIQLICSVLYDEVPEREGVAISTITRAMYEGLGKAEGILRDHLERVLTRDLTVERRPVARRLLEGLISSEGRRIIRSRSALFTEVAPLGIALNDYDGLVSQLVDSRLLRSLEPTSEHPETGYELAHDYLVTKISVDPAVQARKAAQELLEQEVRNYQKFGTLLSEDKLALLAPRRSELVVNEAAKQLLAKSDQAFRRRRGLLVGGVGIAAILLVVAIFSGVATITAQNARVSAEQAQAAAQTQAAEAQVQVGEANTLRATAQAEALLAGTFRVEAENQRQLAEQEAVAVRATAEAASAEASARLGEKDAALTTLFRNNGLVPVGPGPSAFAFDGTNLWVSNQSGDELQAINPATGLISFTVPTSPGVSALTFDGTRLWAANQQLNTLTAIDPKTIQVTRVISTEVRPYAVLLAERRLWVVNQISNTVQVFNPETGDLLGSLLVGNRPWALAYDGRVVWVANRNDNNLMGIDPIGTQVIYTVPVGARPTALAWDNVNKRLWVANQDDSNLMAVDTLGTRRVTNADIVKPASLVRPGDLFINGEQLWIGNQGNGTVTVLNTTTRQSGAIFSTGRLPEAMAIAGERLWVANFSDNTLRALDLAAGNLTGAIRLGIHPRSMAYANGVLWVANVDANTVQPVVTANNTALPAINVGQLPRGLAFDNRGLLWVANSGANSSVQTINPGARQASGPITLDIGRGAREIVFEPVTARMWFINSNGNSLQSIDPRTFRVSAELPLGMGPFNLLAANGKLWIATSRNSVLMVDPATQEISAPIPVGTNPGGMEFVNGALWVANFEDNSISIIDPAQNVVTETVFVGAGPSGLAFDGERVWVANFRDNTVQSIDPVSREVSPPIPVNPGPFRIIYAADERKLWISNFDDNSVQSIKLP